MTQASRRHTPTPSAASRNYTIKHTPRSIPPKTPIQTEGQRALQNQRRLRNEYYQRHPTHLIRPQQ